MTIGRLFKVVFALLGILSIASALLIGYHASNRRALVRLEQQRFASYQLADELRHSSDELTRFARTYVVTADPKYERYYHDVLAIRNGTQPRPADYQRIYWDFRIDRGSDPRPAGAPVALREMMVLAGITAEELEHLKKAQDASDSLVIIEETAMHAARGEYRDATGAFTRRGPPNQPLAIRLMHDSVYHHEKARIMAPIDSFLGAVEARTASELLVFHQATARLLWTIEAILAVFLLVVLASYFALRWKVLLPVRGLQDQTRLVAADLDRLADISAHIAYGDLTQSFAVSTSPIGSTRRDEVGELSRLHDSMVARLQATGASIAAVTSDLRAATDAAESATRAKGAFLAHMSHEIRTPLNAVLGYAQLLQADGSLNSDQRRKIAAIYTSGDHLLELLNGILEMSRIEAGRLSASVQPFDLHALLDGVQSMFTELTSRRGLKFDVQTAHGLVRGLRSDPGKVRQVLINLLSNAVKFTDRGSMAVRLRASSLDVGEDRCRVTVEVEDTGPGIPAEDRERIFTPFGQAEAGKHHSGAGLGLTISRNIARLLGGDLTVRSEVGQGSTFTFTFIAARVPDHELEDAQRPQGQRRLGPSETRRKALVVDDVPSNRELLQETLSRAGFDTRSAASGEQALEVNRAWAPDLIMTDLHMPGMGGLAAVQRLRAEQTRAAIVVTSAGDSESTPAMVAAAGAAAFLRKPYRESDLFDTISRATGLTFVDASTAGRDAPETGQPLEALRDIPPELVVELRDACRQARAPRLIQLADRVAEHSGAAADAIRKMANGFQYRALLEALDGANGDKS